MTEGLSAVMARISQIESMLSPPPALAPSSASSGSAGTSAAANSTDGTGFQDALNRLTSGYGQSPTTDPGAKAVSIATGYLGTPYRWGGTDPTTGLDCSGFTQLVFKQVGVALPRTSGDQASAGTPVSSIAQAKPGDLVFFGSPVHHVGIYVGDGKMIDAPHKGTVVQIRKVYETPSAIRRVLTDTGSAVNSASALSALLSGTGSTGGMNNAGTSGVGSTTAAASGGSLAGTPYAALFTAAEQRYGVDPALLSAVARQESDYQPGAVSKAGAQGLMQLMPGTARSLGVDPNVPAQAVDGAARLMADNLRSFNGRVDLALAAYNAGAPAVRKYNGVPPYAETRNYVQQVQRYWGELR